MAGLYELSPRLAWGTDATALLYVKANNKFCKISSECDLTAETHYDIQASRTQLDVLGFLRTIMLKPIFDKLGKLIDHRTDCGSGVWSNPVQLSFKKQK